MSFWIGEKVFLIKSKRFGIIEKLESGGKIKVKVGDKFIYTNSNNIKVADQEEYTFPEWVFEKEAVQTKKLNLFPSDTIDLHIEKLEPSMENEIPAVILSFQLKKCRSFLQQSVERKRSVVFIICGKGAGVLKAEVYSVAKSEFSAKLIVEKNNGGMLEVWL